MTNIAEMTNTELEAALNEAVNTSNWYFGDNETLCEYWHLRACELQCEVYRREGNLTMARRWKRLMKSATRESA